MLLSAVRRKSGRVAAGGLLTLLMACTQGQDAHGVVVPAVAEAGEFSSWQVIVTVGQEAISTGGSIKIQWPSGWYTSPWPEGKLKAMQFTDPEANHYLTAGTSRSGAELALSIVRKGVDGQHDRYGRGIVMTLEQGRLRPGDEVTLRFNHTTAPITSEMRQVAIAIDHGGTGIYRPLESYPHIEVLPARPAKIRLIAPSQAMVGRPTKVTVVALDQYENATGQYRGSVQLRTDDTTAALPPPYRLTADDHGVKILPVTFNAPGIQRLKLYGDMQLAPHGIASNPVRVSIESEGLNLYWGDLHAHSGQSKDGAGAAATAYGYARDVAILDFFALTDHAAGDFQKDGTYWVGTTPAEWEHNRALAQSYTITGKFVALLASEWSGRTPYGHHNIFYRGLEGQPLGEDVITGIDEIWGLLEAGEAFTIPHHTGITWPGGGSPDTDWRRHRNDALRPAIEIYSLWGSGEFYGNDMSYEHYFQRNFTSHKGPSYARDAWGLGHHIGSVAGSDDHNSHPGPEHGGLTAVNAPALTRTEIFDAILRRHTYATTGQRILLEFTIQGNIMGTQIQLPADAVPRIQVKVTGTDLLDWVEVMKFDGREWSLVFEDRPASRVLEATFTDDNFSRSSLYYVRLRQRNLRENRPVMAWSSPIWVARSSSPWWEVEQ